MKTYGVLVLVLMTVMAAGYDPEDRCGDELKDLEEKYQEVHLAYAEAQKIILELQDRISEYRDRISDAQDENASLRSQLEQYRKIAMVVSCVAGALASAFLVIGLYRMALGVTRSLFGGMMDYIAVRLGYRVPVRYEEIPLLDIPVRSPDQDYNPGATRTRVLESNVPGSEYRPTQFYPKCQFELLIETASGHRVIGQGFRLNNYLVTAGHVLTDLANIGISDFTIRTPSGQVHQSIKQWTDKKTADLYYRAFDQATFQCLNLAKAKIMDSKYSNLQLPIRVCTMSYSTSGHIASIDNGVVWYRGSTKEGYSGAPYMWNECVVAMHIGSMEYAYGNEASLVESFLPIDKKESNVDGTGERVFQEVLEEFMKTGKKADHYLTPGEIRVKRNGKFYVLDIEDLPEAWGPVLDYWSGAGSKPHYNLESNVPANRAEIDGDGNNERQDKTAVDIIIELINSNAEKEEARMIELENKMEEKQLSFMKSLKELQISHIDRPNMTPDSKNFAEPPVVEASGKKDLVTGAQSLEKKIDSLQKTISKLATRVDMIGQGSTRAQQKKASPNTSNSS